jgi:beta-ureidopropionase / N-carbamoyl-L-amino-acid hydrolase
METSAIGATPKGGLNRLTLTDLDRQVRDWFKARVEKLGCTVTVDSMGAMFARRPGRADIPPIALGSHLDTQPTGGKFDGVLGVLAALETLRTLVEAGYETYAPIEIVNWTNEEGARFAPAMVSSGVFAGAFEHDWASARRDPAGVTFAQALDAIGYRGTQRCGEHPLSAFFELHIEQGPILEAEDKTIGIVTGIQGIRWFEATIRGEDRHTGTTPMHLRKNALLGAARLVERIDAIARSHAPQAVGTVGRLEVKPNSPNVVPGEVFFTVDLRHPDAAVLDELQDAWTAAGYGITDELGLEVEIAKILDQPPVRFDADCIGCVREGARAAGFAAREIVSGAGHDAGYVSRVAPSAMIFVPCRGGISHNEAEYASPEHCAAGAQVLLQAVLSYDRLLQERMSLRGS